MVMVTAKAHVIVIIIIYRFVWQLVNIARKMPKL